MKHINPMAARALTAGWAILCLNCITLTSQSRFVDPFIGTDGMGHTFPGACVPFGGVQLSPDTDTIPHNVAGRYQSRAYEYCAGYQYSDSTIVGFSHTHFSGTGHSDLGDILLMPVTGPVRLNPGTEEHPDSGYRSRFDHSSECASPGYYAVTLKDYGIRAELTATPRTGVHRYTFPESAPQGCHVILDLDHGIYNYDGKTLWSELTVHNDTLLTGCRISNGWARTNYTYFAIVLSRPLEDYGFIDRATRDYRGGWAKFDQFHHFPEMAGRRVAAHLDFGDITELTIKVGISATGVTGALKNLRAEAGDASFDDIKEMAEKDWDKELSIFEISGTEDQKRMFYTSLYHTMINPSVYMDVDGTYRGLDHELHKADGFTNYTVFSLWDTYRAEHPLLTLLQPDREKDMIMSMLAHQRQSPHGMLPIWSHMANENWCMSGYHSVSVIADGIVKGLDIDPSEALRAMVSTSNVDYYCGLGEYKRLGYVPDGASGASASNTLEYAYDDWTIWRTAIIAGDTDAARTYLERARNYRNIFDHSTGFARPRRADGTFREIFDVKQTVGQGFIEGNSWNFSFHVPHDVPGMIELMGGEKAFTARMDEMFGMDLPEIYYADNEDVTADCLIGGYVHGNEPSHHIPYLYAWTSQPWKTQYWVREIMNRMYRPEIRGLGGNDDCGQMSAWYIFSAMGFYPVCPGSDEYVLGAPYLPSIKVTLPNGNVLEIKAKGVDDHRRYVRCVLLNGVPVNGHTIKHADILKGGVLEFRMSGTVS